MENVKIILKDLKCKPFKATEGSSGYDVMAYDIIAVEAINSKVIKTFKQLGKIHVPFKDSTTNNTSLIEKDQIFELNTLYRCLVDTGIEIAHIPKGYEIQVRPRSGLALKAGIIVVNSPGTVDSDYRGTLGVILCNLGNLKFPIARYDRIAQIVFQKVEHPNEIEVTDVKEQTTRNEGGFGSTGSN